MPSSEDFNYEGLRVEHASDWSPIKDYQNRLKPNQDQSRFNLQPMTEMKGVLNPNKSPKQPDITEEERQEMLNANRSSWKNLGLTNNEIIDN